MTGRELMPIFPMAAMDYALDYALRYATDCHHKGDDNEEDHFTDSGLCGIDGRYGPGQRRPL